ncbi:MAG: DUF1015 domain-containing protein [Bacteroidetes bacterium]|nr:DUF1015 domain-containing protein [Bacteroidota bacterium]
MPSIHVHPFRGLRPANKFANQVITLTDIAKSEDQLRQELESEPLSFLHLMKPNLHFAEGKPLTEQHYAFSRNYRRQLQEQQVLVLDDIPYVYIYKQILADGTVFEGVILGIEARDYAEGRIRKHEHTLTAKEDGLVDYIQKLQMVGEPVLLANPNEWFFSEWMHNFDERPPAQEFTDMRGTQHQLWLVSEPKGIADLQMSFAKTQNLYIADGHHRIAAVARYQQEHESKAETQLIMAFVLPESSLRIKSFHRLLQNMDPVLCAGLPDKAAADFEVTRMTEGGRPSRKGEIVYLGPQGWYKFTLKPGHAHPSPSENLDVYQLEDLIFRKHLGITDSKTDEHLLFVNGDESLHSLESRKDRGEITAAFVLFPNSMKEIREVADADETMPPKSTWIEPKLPAGMVIHTF